MTNGLIGTEFHPAGENLLLRTNDLELRKAISTIYSRGAFAVSTSIYTSSQTMDHRVSVALCDTSGGAISLTLPYANYWGDSKSPNITFVHVAGSADVTILPAGSDSIDGVGSYILSAGERVDIVSDGDDSWYILAGAASTSVTTVRSYGALGDGVTNDTAAFTAAGSADTDLTMVVPSGVYRLATNPAPTGNTTWLVYPEVFFAGPGQITPHVLPSTLNGAITNVATSITINSTTGWPSFTTSHTSFYAVLSDGVGYEIIEVTARSGTTLTVVRGQYGTTGRAFGNGADCTLNLLSPTTLHYLRDSVTTSFHDDRGGLSILDSSTFSELTKGYASLRVGMFDGWETNYWGLPGAGATAATSDWVAFQAGIASNPERQRLWVSNMTLEIGTDPAETAATAWGIELDVGIYAANPNAPVIGGGLGHASDPGNDYHVIGIDLECVGDFNPSAAFRCSAPTTTRWKHGVWLEAVGWKTSTTADGGWGIGSSLFWCDDRCSVEHGIDISRATIAGYGLKIGDPVTGNAPIGLMQFANGGATIFMQRFTDTAPTGYFLSAVNAANSQTLFSIGVAGDINTVSTIAATGAISTSATLAAGSTITGTTITGSSLVSTGLIDASAAGAGQIKFPATQNASGDANTLDDYEEGTWTPVLTFETPGDLSVTYSSQTGQYTKIGNRVFLSWQVATSAFTHTTAAGQLKITGLPFTCNASVASRGEVSWVGITPSAGYTQIQGLLPVSDTAMYLRAMGSGKTALESITYAHTTTGTNIGASGSIVYAV